MRLKIQFMVPAFLCALSLVSSSYGVEDPAEQIKQAERLCVKKQFQEAEQIYLNIVQQTTDAEQRFSAQRKLAAVLVAQDKQPLARAAVEGILSEYARHERLPHAIHEIAESCQKFGKGAKAREIYQAILKDQPGHPQRIWLDMGLAISNILAGEPDAGWAATQKLLNEYKGDSRAAEAVGQVAWCYRKQKDYQNARTLYQHVVDTWPDNERAIYSQRGIILTSVELKDPNSEKAAIEKLFRDYSRHKDFVNVVSYVAESYREKRQFKESRELHQYIVEKHPASDQAIWSQRSIVLSSIGLKDDPNTQAGIENLLRDFGRHKDIAKAVYQVAGKLSYGNEEHAKRLYRYIVDNHPSDDNAILARVKIGQIDLRLGNDKAALGIFDQVLTDFANHPILVKAATLIADAYWDRATVEEKEGRHEAARDYYRVAIRECERVIGEFPETPHTTAEAHYLSARCYERLGEYSKAAELDRTVVDKWPEYTNAWKSEFRAAKISKQLILTSEMSDSEGDAAIRGVLGRLLEDYPDCPGADRVRNWLDNSVTASKEVEND